MTPERGEFMGEIIALTKEIALLKNALERYRKALIKIQALDDMCDLEGVAIKIAREALVKGKGFHSHHPTGDASTASHVLLPKETPERKVEP